MSLAVYGVLLRAIGPVTHKVMSMADWREAAAAAGFADPRTVLATGNMVLGSDLGRKGVETRMTAVVRQLGLKDNVAVFARGANTLARIVEADPFPTASRDRPSQLAVHFFATPRPDFGWIDAYDGDERIAIVGTHLVVDYGDRQGQSLRLPGLIERRSGTATARNWSTLTRLNERIRAWRKEV